jgi:hypothetical protein
MGGGGGWVGEGEFSKAYQYSKNEFSMKYQCSKNEFSKKYQDSRMRSARHLSTVRTSSVRNVRTKGSLRTGKNHYVPHVWFAYSPSHFHYQIIDPLARAC